MTNTREQILLVAEDLIQKVGISAMSYQDISNAIGIKKASIHHHFPKKDDLIHELLQSSSTIYEENYLKVIRKPISAADKLEEIAKLYALSLQEEKICLIGMLSVNNKLITQDSKNKLADTIEQTKEIFSLVFNEGQKNGTLIDKLSAMESANIFLSSLIGLQIISRVDMRISEFDKTIKALISSWKV